jgi:periplasmic protein TonB
MFVTLLSSQPQRERKSTAAATAVSVAGHAALIGLIVWATLAEARQPAHEEEHVTMIELPKEQPPPPPPPPPPDAAPPPPKQVVPKGFQVLTPPDVVPPKIPPPTAKSMEVTEADFSGEGVEGGRSTGKVVTAENVEAAPIFTPYTVAPELKNRSDVARALERDYPILLKDAGIGGTVLVWFLIDEDGRVIKTQIKDTSGQPALDQAALKVASIMIFTPALNRDRKVKVWVALPIVFRSS